MARIDVSTLVHAPRERVFDLARSIDVHQDSTQGTQERAVAGVLHGLIELDEQVTWEARHFGIRQRLTATISAFDRPRHFQDRMLAGAFKSLQHDHDFAEHEQGTLMRDRLEFRSPFGVLGRIADKLVLTAYMRRFLLRRNAVIKQIAETDAWRRYLEASE